MRHLAKLRVFLVLLALASAWLSWPVLARWNFGAAPREMAFKDYIADGARAPSVRLHGVLVDANMAVGTELVKSNGQSRTYAGSYLESSNNPCHSQQPSLIAARKHQNRKNTVENPCFFDI